MRERALPAGVRGPVLLVALRLFAAICLHVGRILHMGLPGALRLLDDLLGSKTPAPKKRTGRTGPGAQDHVEVDGYCFMWRIVPVGAAGRFRR
jgi:hypothetical protein